MNDITKIALVGCGYWGKNLCRNFHALNALARVVDATESGQAQARLIAPRIKVSSHFEDALNDTQIQAVAIATPAETHAELAIKAMKAGNRVVFDEAGSYIESKRTGEKTWMSERNGMFIMKLWVKRPF